MSSLSTQLSCILTRGVYELYCCILHCSSYSYRKETALKPFPSHFSNQSDSSQIGEKNYEKLSLILDEYMPSVSILFNKIGKKNMVFQFSTEEQLTNQVKSFLSRQVMIMQ